MSETQDVLPFTRAMNSSAWHLALLKVEEMCNMIVEAATSCRSAAITEVALTHGDQRLDLSWGGSNSEDKSQEKDESKELAHSHDILKVKNED